MADEQPTPKPKLNLKDATNKVNAEALRQFHIDAEEEKRKAAEAAAAAGAQDGAERVPTPPKTPKPESRPGSSRSVRTPSATVPETAERMPDEKSVKNDESAEEIAGEGGDVQTEEPGEGAKVEGASADATAAETKAEEATDSTAAPTEGTEDAPAAGAAVDAPPAAGATVEPTPAAEGTAADVQPTLAATEGAGVEPTQAAEGATAEATPAAAAPEGGETAAPAAPAAAEPPVGEAAGDAGGDGAPAAGGEVTAEVAATGEAAADGSDQAATGESGAKEEPAADATVAAEPSATKEAPGEPTDAPLEAPAGDGTAEAKGGETVASPSGERKKSPIEEKYSEILDYNEEEDVDPGPAPDFYYDLEKLYAKAKTSSGEGSTPANFLKLYHSFGYECLKRANLHVLDEQHVVFAAGNYVQILNLETKALTYLPTIGGRGIGSIAVHPTRKYFAVGERGYEPDILIFEYPSLKLYRVCRLGTETAYAYLSFSPKGDKLASLGSVPDYMLTIWDWKREKIILRSKAHGQDVFRVSFSTEIEGHLTTSGLGHIKFWKMAATFTGLKLQGELGKFGRTAISDIEGYVELPDGKVLSGSEWGNMLLWDGDLIKCELTQPESTRCHKSQVQEIFLDEGELITAGHDGHVKIWDFETIDGADVMEEDAHFPMEPMSDMFVGDGVKIISMCKTVSENNNDTNSMWLAQDAAGGIWKLDISVSLTKRAPDLIQSYHAGKVRGVASCPYTHMAASIGEDGTVRVSDYLRKKTLTCKKYKSGGSCIMWPGRAVDNKMTTLIGGFTDGVIRIMAIEHAEQEYQFDMKIVLQHVFKPHKGEVSAMIVDDEGKTLVTASSVDSTIFFFDITSSYMPVGFIKLEAPPTTMAWSSESKRVLVGLETGVVLEVELPDPGEVDTSVTYEISNTKINRYPFKSVLYKLRRAAHEKVQMKKEEEQKKRLDKIKEDLGEEAYEEEKKLIEEERAAEEEPSYEPPALPSKILKILPFKDKFYLSMDGEDAGVLYECTFSDPLTDMPVPGPLRGEWVRLCGEPLRVIDLQTETTVHEISIMIDDSNVMMGMGDGTIRIHKKLPGPGLNLGAPYTLPAHSEEIVGAITTSHDTRFLLSGGDDGNMFVYRVNHAGVELSLPSPAENLLKVRGKEEMLGAPADDIDDLKAYSIEEAKQKREYEKMLKTAEDKKVKVRKTIATLRSKFRKIRLKNKELPHHLSLSAKDFEMDPLMESIIAGEVTEKKDLLRRQLAWDSEKARLQLAKLRKRFKDVVATDRVVLHAIETDHTVSTFRCAKPSEAMQKALDEFRTKLAQDETSGHRGSDLRRISTLARQGMSFVRKATELDMHGAGPGPGGTQKHAKKLKDAKANKSLAKAEERKSKRIQREQAWKNLYARKPSENYEDPKMLAAIEDAKNNMGDFNLKTATNYKVPESQRKGTTFKRGQLLELRRMMYTTKMEFNGRLLALRDRKETMIAEAGRWESRLDEIRALLPADRVLERPPVPVLLEEEKPERKMEFTPESLREFKKEHDEAQKRGTADEGGFGGFGGFGGGGDAPPAAPTKLPEPKVSSKPSAPTIAPSESTAAAEEVPAEEEALPPPADSTLESENSNLEQLMILHEQQCLIEQMHEAYEEFDSQLLALRADKIETEVQLKNGDLRVIMLFEELLLLKEFEKRENHLQENLSSKLNDRDEMSEKIEELEDRLANKKLFMSEMQENERLLYESFTEQLGENNKFAEFLTKVFKKKIKRVKKTAEAEEDSDASDSDDDFDSSSEEEEDDDEDAVHLDLNVCPPGCSQELYDATIVMREKKLDLEESIQEEKKMIDSLKKEVDALVKKNKVINHGVKGAKNDLEAFQLEKQKKMNELDIVVTLNLHQIQYMQNGSLPPDLTTCLVFHSGGVNQLTSRIKGLQQEKAQQIRKFKELKRSHIHLIKGKKAMEGKLVELEEKYHAMMLLKFGREVDLTKLENISTNRIAEELKETIAKKDLKFTRRLSEWDVQINQAKQTLLNATREHTGRLDTLNELTKDKQDLENQLDGKQKDLGGEYSGQRKADLKERQRLLQLVQLQAQEIDALKEEIGILSRKDGHILPPTQTTVPPLPPIGAQ